MKRADMSICSGLGDVNDKVSHLPIKVSSIDVPLVVLAVSTSAVARILIGREDSEPQEPIRSFDDGPGVCLAVCCH